MKRVCLLFYCTVLGTILSGQSQDMNFPGGNGRGSTMVSIAATLLAGGGTTPLSFYGGNGNGSTVKGTQRIQLAGGDMLLYFSGGSGNGSNSRILSSTGLGGLVDVNFTGGNGSGSALRKIGFINLAGITVDTSKATQILYYSGGSGRGSTIANPGELLLGGNQIVLTFSGGIGNGSDVEFSKILQLSGANYVQVFSGGVGRGNFLVKSNSITLNGIPSQGFARIAQSAIRDFRVIPRNKRVKLHWVAENPQILDHFVVEKSRDGITFSSVGFVSSATGAQTGSFSFNQPGDGLSEDYFRLLQVFKDSSFSYSNILKVAQGSEDELISLYPNPVQNTLHISISRPEENNEVLIYDHAGKLVRHIPASGVQNLEVEIPELIPGLYWLELKGETVKNRIRFTRL